MKAQKILALALGSVLVVSSLALFAGCNGGGKTAAEAARICFDNLPDDGIEIPDSYTKYAISGVKSRTETDASGETVENGTVVDYVGGKIVAKSAGTAVLDLGDGKTFCVEVVPAYVTDPHNQYDLSSGNDYSLNSSSLLGHTHDPSLIETTNNGKPVYYIFSTGWNTGNDVHRSEDLIHWTYEGKTMTSTTAMEDITEWEEESNATIQWWAPDIVRAADGGYWLYTCAVSNSLHNNYSKACIVLFHSRTLKAGSFEYVGVLMQSAIPDGSAGTIDVNSIDPQIVYTPDGKMYMAYGSFGMGNWILELDPETGLRKDNFYRKEGRRGKFISFEDVRAYEAEAEGMYFGFLQGDVVESEFYGRLISLRNMEAPVIARHDNVTVTDENGKTLAKNKTYYYSMHSYNPLAESYQMWGGRSEDVLGVYRATTASEKSGGIVYNAGLGNSENQGNKYTGRFTWADAVNTCIKVGMPGHNDLFTTKSGHNIAAYIVRTTSFAGGNVVFLTQTHSYYLNSMGNLVINPNRYGGEIDRAVSCDELFQYTDGGRFKMVALANDDAEKVSVEVVLNRTENKDEGTMSYQGAEFGTWKMYGNGYICFRISNISAFPMLTLANEITYYGVVRPAWLDDQNKSGFTITCMGQTEGDSEDSASNNRHMGMFMNNISTLSV